MPIWLLGLLVAAGLLGLIFKPLRTATIVVLLLLLLELIIIIAYPKTLVWLAEVALRLRGVASAF